MKTVFDNHMVAHVWAQRSQPHGRSTNGNFYFDGSTLYSYGRHFIVAKFANLPNGEVCVFFNSETYSVSTSRHQSLARSAASHYKSFTVPYISHLVDVDRETHLRNLQYFEGKITHCIEKEKKARKYKDSWARQAARFQAEYDDYKSTFNLVDVANASQALDREMRLDRFNRAVANADRARAQARVARSLYDVASAAAHVWDSASLAADLAQGLGIEHARIELTRFESAAIDKAMKAWGLDWRSQYMARHWNTGFKSFEEKLERLDAIAEAQALLPALIEKWHRGELRHLDRYSLRDVEGISDAVLRELRIMFNERRGALLRISGDEIETSQGARFPVEHAKRAFRLVAACREKAQEYKRGDHSIHLGHFVVDSIDARGNVKAGCHFVEWPAIEHTAKALQLI